MSFFLDALEFCTEGNWVTSVHKIFYQVYIWFLSDVHEFLTRCTEVISKIRWPDVSLTKAECMAIIWRKKKKEGLGFWFCQVTALSSTDNSMSTRHYNYIIGHLQKTKKEKKNEIKISRVFFFTPLCWCWSGSSSFCKAQKPWDTSPLKVLLVFPPFRWGITTGP